MSRSCKSTQPGPSQATRSASTTYSWSRTSRTPDDQLTPTEWETFSKISRGELPLPELPTPNSRKNVAIKILETVNTAINDLQKIDTHLSKMHTHIEDRTDGDWDPSVSELFLQKLRTEKDGFLGFLETKAESYLVFDDSRRIVVNADLEKFASNNNLTWGLAGG